MKKNFCTQGQVLGPCDVQHVAFYSFWWCNELFTHIMWTLCTMSTQHRPGRLRLIHMQMWGGAGAKKREEMSLSESSMRERRKRGKETACSEECRGEDRLLFLQHEALHCGGRLQTCQHPWRQMTDARGRRTDGGMTATSQTRDEEEIAGWGRSCRWTDGEECDSSLLLCYSFSHSCTDPGWVYSGSPSCRRSGPSPAPSSSGPSSHSLQAWSHSTLPETQRCPGTLHYPSEGGAEAATFPVQHCSVHTHTCPLTHIHTAHRQGERCMRSLL